MRLIPREKLPREYSNFPWMKRHFLVIIEAQTTLLQTSKHGFSIIGYYYLSKINCDDDKDSITKLNFCISFWGTLGENQQQIKILPAQ